MTLAQVAHTAEPTLAQQTVAARQPSLDPAAQRTALVLSALPAGRRMYCATASPPQRMATRPVCGGDGPRGSSVVAAGAQAEAGGSYIEIC